MADEGFHEIQLSGKQLVFLFMAGTVAAVVVFLAGVMVGRDIQAPRAATVAEAAEAPADPTATAQAATTLAGSNAPVSAQETLTYAERLEAPVPPPETLKEPVPPPETLDEVDPAPPPSTRRQRAVSTNGARQSAEVATDLAEPSGSGWAVQVTAVQRPEAEAIARRLKDKGYPAYVAARANNLFAVRIGKYATLRAAEDTAARLRKEEQFNPWVTR